MEKRLEQWLILLFLCVAKHFLTLALVIGLQESFWLLPVEDVADVDLL